MVSPPADDVAATDGATPAFDVLIPARLASSRLPRKPLAEIGGVPMIVHVARQALRSGAGRVAVATDSHEIAAAVRSGGFEVVLTRADHPSGTDRLAEAAAALGLPDERIVVNVQGDEPEMPPALVAQVAAALARAPEAVMSTAAHPISEPADFLNPNVVKVITDRHGHALLFSRAPIPWVRAGMPGAGDPALPAALLQAGLPLRHIGIYAFRNRFLQRFPALPQGPLETLESLEQMRVLWHGERIVVTLAAQAAPAGIDTPEDLDRVRARWQALGGPA